MPPDLNSLPASSSRTRPNMSASPLPRQSRRISSSGDNTRPSPPPPQSPTLSSLQAAAVINSGLHRSPSSDSPSIERRRSSLMNNLHLNDPSIPSPGELQQTNGSNGSSSGSSQLRRRSFVLPTADPHRQRQPSLGALHQELENEQEAQVNRLLLMIRTQQDQLAALQRSTADTPSGTADAATTAAALAISGRPSPHATSIPQAPTQHIHHPHSLSRQSSSRLSNAGLTSTGTSPALRPQSGSLGPLTEDFSLGGGTRDGCAFYQAESQMLTRENQMLKSRIRELERQVSEMGGLSLPATTHRQASTAMLSHHSLAIPPATFATFA
ncbi:hypothetical protein DOTSEDRAFT_69524 [Dothistroma septosporum NZE10]|uniref:Uncharacterized protein n=1 Tax=Dothistroma septosporum (strain NZE10 / CBS 128990) TaxID=675120 RepID=N1PZH8_DOTSN|nr:hypothetical protein DOTSEDRAFT_69524 [Dothistroma septosporum NZE10]